MVTRMREKGQVTIPSGIRESLNLDKDSILTVTKVGDGILLFPGVSAFDEAAAKFRKAAKDQGITLDDLLLELRKIRQGRS